MIQQQQGLFGQSQNQGLFGQKPGMLPPPPSSSNLLTQGTSDSKNFFGPQPSNLLSQSHIQTGFNTPTYSNFNQTQPVGPFSQPQTGPLQNANPFGGKQPFFNQGKQFPGVPPFDQNNQQKNLPGFSFSNPTQQSQINTPSFGIQQNTQTQNPPFGNPTGFNSFGNTNNTFGNFNTNPQNTPNNFLNQTPQGQQQNTFGMGNTTPNTFGQGNLNLLNPNSNPNPGFGTSNPNPGFGTSNPNPGFGTSNPNPGFGTSNPNPGFGTSNPNPGFGTSNPNSGFGNLTQTNNSFLGNTFGNQGQNKPFSLNTGPQFPTLQTQQPTQTPLFGNTQGQSQLSQFMLPGQNNPTQTNTFGNITQPLNTPWNAQKQEQNPNQINSTNLILQEGFKNSKGQIVNSLAYLSEMNGINLSQLRLNDYNLMRQGKLSGQQEQSFRNYLQMNGNQLQIQQQQAPVMPSFSQSNPLPFGQNQQTQPSLNMGMNLNKPLFGNTDSNPIPLGYENKEKPLFNFQNDSNPKPFESQPLFGNNQGGMFGNTGLNFGNTNTQNSGGLFGQNQTQNNGGLFGNTLSLQPQNSMTGPSLNLFGQPPKQNGFENQQTDLFGQKPSAPTLNLFGSQQNNQQAPVQSQNVNSSILGPIGESKQPYLLYYIPMNENSTDQLKNLPIDIQKLVKSNIDIPHEKIQDESPYGLSQSIILPRQKEEVSKGLMKKYLEAQKSMMSQLNFEKKKSNKIEQTRITKQMSSSILITKEELFEEKLTLFVELDLNKRENRQITVNVEKGKMVSFLIKHLIEKKYIDPEEGEQMEVRFDDKPLNIFYTFGDYSFVQSGSKLLVKKQTDNLQKKILAPKEVIPKIGKDLKCKPSFEEMARMTELQLSCIHNFKVFNEHGKIEFLEPVDVRRQDFSQIFNIKSKKIEVYPEAIFGEGKPKIGEEFNQPAYLYFHNMKPEMGKSFNQYYSKIEAFVKSINASLINLDRETNTLKIKVKHF